MVKGVCGCVGVGVCVGVWVCVCVCVCSLMTLKITPKQDLPTSVLWCSDALEIAV